MIMTFLPKHQGTLENQERWIAEISPPSPFVTRLNQSYGLVSGNIFTKKLRKPWKLTEGEGQEILLYKEEVTSRNREEGNAKQNILSWSRF